MNRVRKQVLMSLSSGAKSFWELINGVDTSIFELVECLDALISAGVVRLRGGIFELARPEERMFSAETRCECCKGTGTSIKSFESVYKKYCELVKGRPLPVVGSGYKYEYDQGIIFEDDVIRRVAFMHARGDLNDSEIIVVGDDDLMSVAIAATGLAKRILVLEIDERLVNFINKVATAENFPLEAEEYDVRERLPTGMRGGFDVFVTDPLETVVGFELFLSRCAEALKPYGAGFFGLTRVELPLARWQLFEKFLLDMNFVITDILKDFSSYAHGIENPLEGIKDILSTYDKKHLEFFEKMKLEPEIMRVKPKEPWYKSSFFRVELVGEVRPKHIGRISGDVYTEA
ncbi:MAG: Aminopropyltransferase BpsA [Candidatus Alkanophagales archaeon MCA70_species_2]|nr:Aminopropyltransferase BpsA [Candidatus Alkanophaga liquidiphilum]